MRVNEFIKDFPVDEFYFPPLEIIKNEIKREIRRRCNIIHHEAGFKADIFLR
jgi:hypothetical protein